MKSKKDTSPVRSRDKVLQSLYEMELSGSSAEEILKDLSLQSRYPHYKDLLIGVVDSQEDIDKTLSEFMERDMPSLDPIERNPQHIFYELIYRQYLHNHQMFQLVDLNYVCLILLAMRKRMHVQCP